MAVKIKLKRLGRTRVPHYRIVVADARTKRDGRAIEEIGEYHPKEDPSLIRVDSERAQHWLSVGAQPTAPVKNILKITGDWQKFTGEPGAEGTLRTPPPREDKRERFAAALAESQQETGASTTTRGSRQRRGGQDRTGSAGASAGPDADGPERQTSAAAGTAAASSEGEPDGADTGGSA